MSTSATRVLLIEDNPGDIALTRHMMNVGAPGEFELVFAGWLETALEFLREDSFDIIILDLGLPDATGTDGLESILAHAPNCPVVVLSGENDNETAMSAVRDGAQGYILKGRIEPDQFVLSLRGAMLRKQSELDLQVRAFHDELTGLPTRNLLKDRWDRMRRRQNRNGGAIGVLMVDLDNLKTINDKHGHAVGDTVLETVAHRLEGVLRSGDTVARVGGDEFVVLLESIECMDDAELVVQKIDRCLFHDVDTGQHRLPAEASIGVAICYDEDADSLKDVVARADEDMYIRKKAKRTLRAANGSQRSMRAS